MYMQPKQLSLNLTPKKLLIKLPKPDERHLICDLYLLIVNNHKKITILDDSLNPAHPFVIAQTKSQARTK